VITVLAAVAALALGFAPFLAFPLDARRLADFSTGQPPAFWFGRAAILLLVIAAATTTRSLRLAAGCAVAAVATIAVPVVFTPLRHIVSFGWVSYVGVPAPVPTIDASPTWGLGGLLAVATFTAAVLILVMIRKDDQRLSVRLTAVGLFALAALIASFALIDTEPSRTLGEPRRYVDYLPTASAATFSDAYRWFAAGSVVLIVLAAVAARFPFSAKQSDRSS
jgi:uncharacterized membrane protein YqjE